MMMKKSLFRSMALVAALVAADVAMAADPVKTYYRYRNERGIMVIDDNMSPEMARRGYDIVTINGTLIERVPPALTDEQIKEKQVEAERIKEEARIREWEISLLRKYRTVEEIEAARDRVLKEFDNQLEILRGNLVSQRSQIEVQQQRAADLERRGRPVYDSIRDNISALQQEMAATENSIALRQEEIAKVRAEYDADIAQFRKMLARRKK